MSQSRLFVIQNQTTTVPPETLTVGIAYVVAAGASGDWAGQDGDIAIAQVFNATLVWGFVTPTGGDRLWDQNTKKFFVHSGTAWVEMATTTSVTAHSMASGNPHGTSYTELLETPANFTAQARHFAVVNSGANAIEHVQMHGTVFPTTDLYDGRPFYRTDLREQFHYHSSIDSAARWIGVRTKSYSGGVNSNGRVAPEYLLDGPANQSSQYRMDPLPWDAVLTQIQVYVAGTVTGTKFQVLRNASLIIEVTKTSADTAPDGEKWDVEDASFGAGEVPQLYMDQGASGDSLNSPRMCIEFVHRIDA